MKPRTPKQKIFVTSLDGVPLAYTRHHSQREAHSHVVKARVDTYEASIDDLMRIGAEGLAVGGLAPDIDPAQQDLPI